MSHVASENNSKLAGKGLESQAMRIDLERLTHKYTASHEATMSVAAPTRRAVTSQPSGSSIGESIWGDRT